VSRAASAVAIAIAVGAPLASCGGTRNRPQHTTRTRVARQPPVPIELRLELPHVGLSSAPTVSYATDDGHPLLGGTVLPPTATLYVENPDGTRTAVNARADGSFEIRAKLSPGSNVYRFTAAKLGVRAAGAQLAVAWRGPRADAMQRAIQRDPAKYLPPASAGLNRKLPPLGNLPAVAAARITVTFSLSPINAPPPPAAGGGGKWFGGFELTEYYPALESWFRGAPVSAPGLSGQHRIDWLYSAEGLSMEGDGIGLDGKPYHVANVGAGGWLTSGGGSTAQFGNGLLAPFWRDGGYYRNARGALTFPLDTGGWSNGPGVKYVSPPAGITFAPGQSRPLAYLRSVAVDPSLIPLGSHIFIPAYQSINGGWFEADDTGGAIIGRHIDVFRPPPANPSSGDSLGLVNGQRVYIVAPGKPIP
jgi:3D (Asp-Asp-Asp) domain-containing protein